MERKENLLLMKMNLKAEIYIDNIDLLDILEIPIDIPKLVFIFISSKF